MSELRNGLKTSAVERSTESLPSESITAAATSPPRDQFNARVADGPVDTRTAASTPPTAAQEETRRLSAELEALRPKSKSDLTEMALAHKAGIVADAFRGRLPTLLELRNLTEELGVELATAVFLRTIQDSNVHGPFARHVRGYDFSGWDRTVARAAQVEVAIVASNLFQSGRKWGDHVDDWRLWARDLGFTTDVIETDARRSVAANARVIFEHLARSPNRRRIIVTYGQGGAEMRFMLHRRVNRYPHEVIPEEVANVCAWLNICGAFGGSSTSRYFQENRVRRLLARLRMKVAGRNPITLAETSSVFPLWRRPLQTPPGFAIASIVGVPYRAQIPPSLALLYDELARTTPNDGVVSVLEASAHPGWIIPVQGMNHRAENAWLEPVFKRTLAALTGSLDLLRPEERGLELLRERRKPLK